jgi:xylulokinase
MSLMGVDIGSSRCKAVVFAADGNVLAEAAEDYAPQFPAPSHVEMDPDGLWRAVAASIKSAADGSDDPVQAIGLSSHGESFVPVDDSGNPLAPAIMNADNRAAEEAEWWKEQLGREHIFQTTGMIVHPMYPMPKLRWLRIHEPELFERAARFVSVSDYVLLKLGLQPQIAYPLACRFMAFDVRQLRWDDEILAAAELSAERLPPPVPAGTAAGRLSRTAAADLGLQPDVLVVVGGHDQPNGALGMGAIAPGMVTDSLGTWECLVAVADEPTLGETAMAGSLNSYCHVVPDEYITIAYFPAGIMVKWFCDTFCGEDAAAAAAQGAGLHEYLEAAAPEGPTGLCITPHLIGTANPHFDPRAPGVVFGLTQTTSRHQLYKGILEGLACELAIISDLLAAAVGPFDLLRCTGGGARSRLGLQLRATIAGRSMQTLTCPEAVCLGVALLAGTTAGVYASLGEAVAQAVRVAETIPPDSSAAATYARQLEQYRCLYPALAPLREL